MIAFVRLLLFSVLASHAACMIWDTSFLLGNYSTKGEYQYVDLVLDLNTAETAIFNREQEDGKSMWRGYNTSVSPFFRRTNRKFSRTHSTPLYTASANLSGVYAGDVLVEVSGSERKSSVGFALVNRIETADGPVLRYLHFYDGLLGLSRADSQVANFKQFFFRYGQTYCRATECTKTDTTSSCRAVSSTRLEGGPDAFKNYERAVYYTDVKASGLNSKGWSIRARGFKYGSLKSSRPLRLTVSTTTEYLTVPDSVLRTILKTLNAVSNGTKYVVDDDKLITGEPLVFDFNGKEVSVPAMDYLSPYDYGKVWLKIRGGASEYEWIAGEPFIDAIALCLDYKKSLVSLYKVPLIDAEAAVQKVTKNFREQRELPDGTLVFREESIV